MVFYPANTKNVSGKWVLTRCSQFKWMAVVSQVEQIFLLTHEPPFPPEWQWVYWLDATTTNTHPNPANISLWLTSGSADYECFLCTATTAFFFLLSPPPTRGLKGWLILQLGEMVRTIKLCAFPPQSMISCQKSNCTIILKDLICFDEHIKGYILFSRTYLQKELVTFLTLCGVTGYKCVSAKTCEYLFKSSILLSWGCY